MHVIGLFAVMALNSVDAIVAVAAEVVVVTKLPSHELFLIGLLSNGVDSLELVVGEIIDVDVLLDAEGSDVLFYFVDGVDGSVIFPMDGLQLIGEVDHSTESDLSFFHDLTSQRFTEAGDE